MLLQRLVYRPTVSTASACRVAGPRRGSVGRSDHQASGCRTRRQRAYRRSSRPARGNTPLSTAWNVASTA